MSNKHTPGPWFMTGRMTRYVEAKIDGGLIQEVAAVGPTSADGGYGEQQQANARLIAAAPDLLAALQHLLSVYAKPDELICCNGRECGCMGASVYQQAEHYAVETITKATGGDL